MDILGGLNEEQRAAVTHVKGPMLVVAGAGTGKTQVITRRIAFLIQEGHARPSEILALTFTEKAANEMQERLYEIIGWDSFQVAVMTFHGFGSELLARYSSHIGRSLHGGLINDTQKVLLLMRHISEVSLSYYGRQDDMYEFVQGLVEYIGLLQNAGISAEDYANYTHNLSENAGDLHPHDVQEQKDLSALYKLYERVKLESGSYDFSDQIELPLRILRERPNIVARLSTEYAHVLVDEYQDTNKVQDSLLRLIVPHNGNIFAVGDDDQAIYGFRGADVRNILSFTKHFQANDTLALVKNYRSGQEILDAAYKLIRNNDPERLEHQLGINKRLVSSGLTTKAEVSYALYPSSVEEMDAIAHQIGSKINSGAEPGSIAVLAATHLPLKALSRQFRRLGVPFALSTYINIFEQPELISLWHLLQWLALKADDQTVGHMLMGRLFRWSPESCSRIMRLAAENLVSIEEFLRGEESQESRELITQLDEWRSLSTEESVSQLVFRLVFESHLADTWQKEAESKPRMIRVFEDLQRWLDQMQDFEAVATDSTLSGYLMSFLQPPVIETAEPAGDTDGVQLLTVHSSKGLEFDAVYLMGCTQKSWSGTRRPSRPIPAALMEEAVMPALHEYRRLMYVGVTRAKRELHLSAATHTANGTRQLPSPFLNELKGAPIKVEADAVVSISLEQRRKLQEFYPLQTEAANMALPFEDRAGWIELSVTQLSDYDYCPFEFYTRHVLGVREATGPHMNFGTILHKVIERHLKAALTGDAVSARELHNMVDNMWSSRGYLDKESALRDQELAHSTLDLFLERAKDRGEVRASELSIHIELPEAKLRVRGKIDAIFADAGQLEIRDFKTGRGRTDPEKVSINAKDSLQLRTYALAQEVLTGKAPDRVTLDYIVTGVAGEAELSAIILANHRKKLAVFAQKIRERVFPPNTSPLHRCAAFRYYGTGERDEWAEELLANTMEQ